MNATLEDVLPLLKQTKSDGNGGFVACCPAHDDHNPSLSVRKGDKQGVVFHCHAGCEQRAVMTALGLGSTPDGASSTDATTYDYHDEDGAVLYHVVRKAGKKFYQQRADGQGGWINAMGDVRRVPYRLPELIEAIALEKPVYIVEGEKDVETAREYGLIATTNIGGAGKWSSDLSNPHFLDADVLIVPDNDEPGRAHVEQAARSLAGIARSIRVVPLPGLVPKGDLTDWFCGGHTVEELERIVASAPAWTQTTERAPATAPTRNPPYALRILLDRPELTRPPTALIPGIAYSGRVTLLSAREKAGKSTLVGQGAAAFSRGGEFLNERLNRGRVLWYAIDEPIGDAMRRLQSYGADPDGAVIQTERPNVAEMREEILATRADVVVIDTLGELWNGLIRSARDAEEINSFLRPFIVAARECNIALIFLHHTSKAGKEYRDSIQIGASVDIILTLRMPGIKSEADGGEWDTGREDDGRRVLDGGGRGNVKVNLRLAFDGTRYTMGDTPMPLRGRILNELTYDPASGNKLVTVLKAKREAVFAELKSMREENLIVKTEEGKFALPTEVVPDQKPLSLSREPLPPNVIVNPLKPVSNTQIEAVLGGSLYEQKSTSGTTSGTTFKGVS